MRSLLPVVPAATFGIVIAFGTIAAAPAQEGQLGCDPLARPVCFSNSVGMKLMMIPSGEFVMGAANLDSDAAKSESPQHRVIISKPFWMGVHEVTVGNFREFVAATAYQTAAEREPSSGFEKSTSTFQYDRLGFNWRNLGWDQTDDHPVLNVSWHDAVAFCDWLSNKERRRYHLPTEAQWEYACRGGTSARFIQGDTAESLRGLANVQDQSLAILRPQFSNSNSFSYLRQPVPWDDGFPFSAPVGSFAPNSFGLCDMLGNAAEWCGDWYADDYYGASPDRDPSGPREGTARLVRGGAFLHQPKNARVSWRIGGTPTYHNYVIGFRVVCGDQ